MLRQSSEYVRTERSTNKKSVSQLYFSFDSQLNISYHREDSGKTTGESSTQLWQLLIFYRESMNNAATLVNYLSVLRITLEWMAWSSQRFHSKYIEGCSVNLKTAKKLCVQKYICMTDSLNWDLGNAETYLQRFKPCVVLSISLLLL